MCSLSEVFAVVNDIAPISLSEACVKGGDYDNSGIIIKSTENANKILFSLDLSLEAVRKAKRYKCDTVITHHPAIYYPVSRISIDDPTTAPVAEASKANLNVISMHLNLDIGENGIDDCLSKALGAKTVKLLSTVDGVHGYGREYGVKTKFSEFIKTVKTSLDTDKVIAYGNKNADVETVASFCGGGSSYAEKALKDKTLTADTVVTSDVPHHVIREIVESGKKLVIIPHYASEDYGFNRFYQRVKEKIKDGAECIYFSDRRFK